MARTYITGFEFGAAGEFFTDQATYSTTHKRSGTYGAFFSVQANNVQYQRASGGTFTTFALSARFYLKVVALPTSGAIDFWRNENTTPTAFDRIQINSTGTLTITDGTNSATSTNALSVDGLWHRIEFDVGWSSGSGRRVFVDGLSWASTATGASVKHEGIRFGLLVAANNCQLAFDDVMVDDDTFVNSGFPGDGTVTYLPPISDGTLGNWVAGGGAVTSLFDAINNIPPVGVASASSTNTSQIKNSVSSANNDGFFNCKTYTDGGISGTVNAVMPIANHSSSSTTATAGAQYMSSNPSQVAPGQTFDYDNGGAVAGTYPTNWKTQFGPVSVAPTVTLGSSPVVAIRKTTATTRIAFADLLGVYVDWTASAGANWLKENYWWQRSTESSGVF